MKHTEKYTHTEQQKDDRLAHLVFSALQNIEPSYSNTHAWYSVSKKKKEVSTISRLSLPIFGSMFAATFAFVMIISIQPEGETSEIAMVSETAPTTLASKSMSVDVNQGSQAPVLAKIDAQTKITSRAQADEGFTESLAVDTSLEYLFE